MSVDLQQRRVGISIAGVDLDCVLISLNQFDIQYRNWMYLTTIFHDWILQERSEYPKEKSSKLLQIFKKCCCQWVIISKKRANCFPRQPQTKRLSPPQSVC